MTSQGTPSPPPKARRPKYFLVPKAIKLYQLRNCWRKVWDLNPRGLMDYRLSGLKKRRWFGKNKSKSRLYHEKEEVLSTLGFLSDRPQTSDYIWESSNYSFLPRGSKLRSWKRHYLSLQIGNIEILLLDGGIPEEVSSIVLILPDYLNRLLSFFPIFRSFLWFANLIGANGFNLTRIYQDDFVY